MQLMKTYIIMNKELESWYKKHVAWDGMAWAPC